MKIFRRRSGRRLAGEDISQFENEWDDLEYQEEDASETYDGEPITDYEEEAIEEYEDIYLEDENLAEESMEYYGEMPEHEVIYQEAESEYEEAEYEDGTEYEEEEYEGGEPEYEEEEYEDGTEYEEEEYEDGAEYEEEENEGGEPEYEGEEYEGGAEYEDPGYEGGAEYEDPGYEGGTEYEEAEYEGGAEYVDPEYEDGAECEDEELEYGEEQEYEGGAEYEEPEYYEDEEEELAASSRRQRDKGEGAGDRILDRFILFAGAAVLLMAVITGIVLISSRLRSTNAEFYQEAGAQLAGINLVGGQGLEAVASAQQTYAAMLLAVATPEPVETPKPENYDEQDYTPEIEVQMNFSSIEKDLKIKFVNRETGKLIGNVPFSITVTDPNGTSVMWSDDDMDGIIYKKNLTPGQYRLVMNELSDEKYRSYGLVAAEQKTEVKKEIEYKKVDVADEVKTESQVNVAQEDTKINETQVESYLQDTVAWVESTSTMITYAEVAKSNIPDPMTLAMHGSFVRLAQESEVSTQPSEKEPVPTEAPATEAPTEAPATPAPTEAPATPAPTEAPATPAPTEAPATPVPTETPTQAPATPSPTVTPTPIPTVTPAAYVGKINPSSKSLVVGESFNIVASCEGVTLQSITWSSSNSSAVTVDASGKVTAVAVTQQPVLISYEASGVDSAGNKVSGLTASCSVTVENGTRVLKLDKATEVVYIGTPVTLTATLENGPDNAVLTVESSDTKVARAEISGRTVTVTGVEAGTANITVKYTENNNTISAACTVTVKQNPRDNKTSLLKDKEGNELFVLDNNDYRPAYYADYYTADKFFKKGEAKYTGWQTINGAVKYFDINGKAVTGEQVIQGVKYNFASDGALMTGSGTMGIDVSKWNGDIDWNAVKNSGVSYVIIRCGYRGSSQGSLIVDSKFQSNIKGATDAGLKVGVYFFTQAVDRVEAVEEASMALELIKNYRISYPVFLDVEASGGRADGISVETRTEVCKAFCQTIQNAGYTTGIYANKTWLTTKIDTSQLSAYKIWLAQYASAPTYTGRYDLWQYKSTGRVSGINGDVDLNLSYLGY